MAGAILFDQSETAYRMGTGIATYARNLAAAARLTGYRTDALVSADIRIDPADPILSEVRLYDTPPAPRWPWLEPITSVVRGVCRAPFGYRPRLLARAGTVMRDTAELLPFEQTYVERRLFNAARAHFHVYGRLARVVMPAAPMLFHATHPLPVRVAGCPNIVTIHDLVPLRLPYMTLDNKRYFYRLIQKHVAAADHIVTVSEYSRRDIMALFGVPEARITNTYQAVSLPPAMLARPEDDVAVEVANLFGLDRGEFYLFIGALEPKKNVVRLIDAYAASGSRRPLVIAGGQGWQNEADQERMRDPRFSGYRFADSTLSKFERVRRISYLPFNQLVALMRSARALLFPSLFEGFGLPVLEAMSLGTPVMTSNVTSLPEVAGDAALLVDPRDVSAMAAAIRRLDGDGDLLAELSARGRMQAAGFGMAQYQARLQGVYDRVLNR